MQNHDRLMGTTAPKIYTVPGYPTVVMHISPMLANPPVGIKFESIDGKPPIELQIEIAMEGLFHSGVRGLHWKISHVPAMTETWDQSLRFTRYGNDVVWSWGGGIP